MFIKNLRPISLLNDDTKIYSKLLAERLKPFIPKCIHPDQTTYGSDLNITDNLMLIQCIIELHQRLKIAAKLVGVDCKAAFDSINHEYIWKVLEKYNFGPKFIGMIKTLYKNAVSAIINDGYLTDYFSIERSVRQGDCLSPYLFLLAFEPLLNSIRESKKIKGITILNTSETKTAAYADDNSMFLDESTNLQDVIEIHDNFGHTKEFSLSVSLQLA